ncbi:transesterase [Diaporthe helianthi]|uniref:Transesterase n=1 Tax=Diaporthe helianthi TaxID=158607 RepID=A0A2P5HG43_DIAHE|nr:transesterase [Diaporthe helianthi]
MVNRITKTYEDAVASALLPGITAISGKKSGIKPDLHAGRDEAFTDATICAMASMTKLMTAVSVMKCVEQGTLDLDKDVKPLLPEMGRYGIITGFDDDKNQARFEADSTPVTLRMLLCHTSGHEYDWMNPLLGKWRASRNEVPWSGPLLTDKSAIPLVFKPGTNFAYGAGADWAGRLVEVASGMTLEDFMCKYICTPLGTEKDFSFWPEDKPEMKSRMATFSTLNEAGEPPASDASAFDIRFGGKECLGGAGGFGSAQAYYTFLSAVFRRDSRLLTEESYKELFRPQFDSEMEETFNRYLTSSPVHEQLIGMSIPRSIRKSWSLAGMVVLDDQEGRFKKGTTFWGGVPCMMWFMDHQAGICGTAFCQMLPPMHPRIMGLHEEFQRGSFEAALKEA